MDHKQSVNKRAFVMLKTGDPCVLRTYRVVLKPDANTEYEPMFVTLRYRPQDADKLDRDSVQAHREAFKRAVKIERKQNNTPNERQFFDGGVACVRERESVVK